MEDVFTFRNRLSAEYSSFSRSFSKVAAPDILVKVEDEYALGRYWPEPLIQINPNYKRGGTVQQLVKPKLERLEKTQAVKPYKRKVANPASLYLRELLA